MAVFGKFGHRGPYQRGEMRIKYTKVMKILEIVGLAMLLLIVAYTAFQYPQIPDQIPSHFNNLGEADSYGSKGTLWVIPVFSIIVYGLVILASIFPNAWNYPVKMEPEAYPEAEDKVRQLLLIMRLMVTALFGYLQFERLRMSGSISMAVTFVFLLALMVAVIYFIGSLKRTAKKYKKKAIPEE